jgi:hypothetical protein
MRYVFAMKNPMLALLLTAAAAACSQEAVGSESVSANAMMVAAPVPAATSPAEANAANNAGDIPDTQVFVTYTGPGYSVLVPEGWARTQRGSAVTFTSNADSERIDVRPVKPGNDLRNLVGASAAQQMTLRTRERLGGARATVVSFRSQSNANPVTGKRVELDNTAYVSSPHAGRYVILSLSAPAGADNADQWKKIAGSFRWR